MPKIIPLKFREVVSKLKKFGFECPFYGWKHPIMKNDKKRIPVPNHGWKDVSSWVIACIIDHVWVSVEERNDK